MKQIIFIIISICVIYNSNAQTQILKTNLDNNGLPSEDNLNKSNSPYAVQNKLTSLAYDSIRSISELNTSLSDAFPWISPDGLRLYYTSGANNNALMFTQRTNTSNYFDPPVVVPVSAPNPYSYWLSSDELDIYICTDSLLYSHRNTTGTPFNTPTLISLSQPFGNNLAYRSASLNNAQDVLFISAYNGIYLGMFEFIRISPTSFSYVRTLPFPLGYSLNSGQLSKDELTFFCSGITGSSPDRLYQLTRLNPVDSFQLGTFVEIPSINDTMVFNSQPTMSDNLEWVAFVRSDLNTWDKNNLYIASKEATTLVFEHLNSENSISVYPNPFSTEIILTNTTENGEAILYNELGNVILRKKSLAEKTLLNTSQIPPGFYILRYITGKKIENIKVTKL